MHTSLFVCFGLLHLDFFALPQKCVVPPHTSAFSVDLTSAVRDPMGVHWSCVACVGLPHGWGFLRQATGASVSDLCSYAQFFGFGLVLCMCVCTRRGGIFRKLCFTLRLHICSIHKYKQIYRLFKWTNRFETFTGLVIVCTPCWEKRRLGYILNWMQRGDFAEGACAHLGTHGLKWKDLSAGHTVESAFLVPAHCWCCLLPL